MVTLVKSQQHANAYGPISVTPYGMTTLVNLEHSQNANAPIFVPPSGITMLVKSVSKAKAYISLAMTLAAREEPLANVVLSLLFIRQTEKAT